MIHWSTTKHSNEDGESWLESRFIENGFRCERIGRNYFSVSAGLDLQSVDQSKIAKIEFQRGVTIDLRIGSGKTKEIRDTLAFSFRCLCDSDALPPIEVPIIEFYAKKMKHLICCVRYYEASHPVFGHCFEGDRPTVSIINLSEMIVDALGQKPIRVPAKAFRFDLND